MLIIFKFLNVKKFELKYSLYKRNTYKKFWAAGQIGDSHVCETPVKKCTYIYGIYSKSY
jgi:hypothetical protein